MISISDVRKLRKMLEKRTEIMSDQEALEVATYVQRWKINHNYNVGDRVSIDENGIIELYKCIKSHTSETSHIPLYQSDSLWSHIKRNASK